MKAYCPEEFFSRSEIENVQNARLATIVERAARSEFYGRRFAEAGIDPASITTAADIARLPFTTKDDLRSAYPARMLTRPVTDMVRLHASSGTTGSATVIYYTKNDIESWADLMARIKGIRPASAAKFSRQGLTVDGVPFDEALPEPPRPAQTKP